MTEARPRRTSLTLRSLPFRRWWIPHKPAEHAERGDTEGAAFQQPARSRWTILRFDQRAIELGARRRRLRARTCTPLRRLNPSCDRHVRFRRARGTLRRIVDFVAIQAETGVSKLHGSSLLKLLPVHERPLVN